MTHRSKNEDVLLVEKTLIEFSQVHVDANTKYVDAGRKILLIVEVSKSLFRTNVVYHSCFYQNFRSPYWKKALNAKQHHSQSSDIKFVQEFVSIFGNLVLPKQEIYTIMTSSGLNN